MTTATPIRLVEQDAKPKRPATLKALEKKIATEFAKGLEACIKVGEALDQIDLDDLWRGPGHHRTFEGYMRERWGLSKSQGYRFIDAAQVVRTLESPTGDVPRPANESVARELAPLKDDPERLCEKWAEAIEKHGNKPTAADVRAIVKPDGTPPLALQGEPDPGPSRPAAVEELFARLDDLWDDLRQDVDGETAATPEQRAKWEQRLTILAEQAMDLATRVAAAEVIEGETTPA